jgi:hypothetical protein
MQSNVDIALLNSTGELVYWFDAFHRSGFGRQEPLAQYTARNIQQASTLLRLDPADSVPHPLKLPELGGSRGVRVLVRLVDDRMRAYQAAVVETVALGKDDWKLLAYPQTERVVDSARLLPWLSQLYPPGVMERTDPLTKKVYGVKSVEGALSLAAAGQTRTTRFALLRGSIRLTDEGPDRFSYSGSLEVVLTYPSDGATVSTIRGSFSGLYPRPDRSGGTRWIPLQAALESLPE